MLLQIDPEFKAILRPLSTDEYATLEESILADGCRDPLVVWEEAGLLVDGHNRLEICTRYGLGFNTAKKSFASRDEALDWIYANQLGKRNCTPTEFNLYLGERYNLGKKAHGGDRGNQHSVPSGRNYHLPKTAQVLAEQYGVSERTVRNAGEFAESVEKIEPLVPDIKQRVIAGDIPSMQAVLEAARGMKTCEKCAKQWIADLDECPYCTKTPEERIAGLNAERVSKPHVANNSGNNEWYTPPEFIEAARKVMGSIDLDPASSAIANETVQANQFYTAEENGLLQEWSGNVWLNPPYAQPLISDFAETTAKKFEEYEIEQACILVNNATETAWFQRLLRLATAVCFVRSRIRFLNPEGEPTGAPLQGQAVLYLGAERDKFYSVFKDHGVVVYGVLHV